MLQHNSKPANILNHQTLRRSIQKVGVLSVYRQEGNQHKYKFSFLTFFCVTITIITVLVVYYYVTIIIICFLSLFYYYYFCWLYNTEKNLWCVRWQGVGHYSDAICPVVIIIIIIIMGQQILLYDESQFLIISLCNVIYLLDLQHGTLKRLMNTTTWFYLQILIITESVSDIFHS